MTTLEPVSGAIPVPTAPAPVTRPRTGVAYRRVVGAVLIAGAVGVGDGSAALAPFSELLGGTPFVLNIVIVALVALLPAVGLWMALGSFGITRGTPAAAIGIGVIAAIHTVLLGESFSYGELAMVTVSWWDYGSYVSSLVAIGLVVALLAAGLLIVWARTLDRVARWAFTVPGVVLAVVLVVSAVTGSSVWDEGSPFAALHLVYAASWAVMGLALILGRPAEPRIERAGRGRVALVVVGILGAAWAVADAVQTLNAQSAGQVHQRITWDQGITIGVTTVLVVAAAIALAATPAVLGRRAAPRVAIAIAGLLDALIGSMAVQAGLYAPGTEGKAWLIPGIIETLLAFGLVPCMAVVFVGAARARMPRRLPLMLLLVALAGLLLRVPVYVIALYTGLGYALDGGVGLDLLIPLVSDILVIPAAAALVVSGPRSIGGDAEASVPASAPTSADPTVPRPPVDLAQ